MSNIWQSIAGFPLFLLYFATAVALLVLFVAVYMRVMPHRELALIREGNVAAALSLSGALIGFVLPLASAVAHSVNPVDMVVWGVVALLVQLAVYAAVVRLVPHFRDAVVAGRVAPAALLAALAVSAGILNAACLTY
jgi:putative membrane protein